MITAVTRETTISVRYSKTPLISMDDKYSTEFSTPKTNSPIACLFFSKLIKMVKSLLNTGFVMLKSSTILKNVYLCKKLAVWFNIFTLTFCQAKNVTK